MQILRSVLLLRINTGICLILLDIELNGDLWIFALVRTTFFSLGFTYPCHSLTVESTGLYLISALVITKWDVFGSGVADSLV